MKGTITGRDVFLHAHTIVRLWGVPTFLACAWAAIARRRSTFLGVLYPPRLVANEVAPQDPALPRWRSSR